MTPLFKRSSVFGRYWLFFVVLSFLLYFFDYRGSDTVNHIRAFLSIPLEPLRVLINKPFEWSDQLTDNFSSHQDLAKENEYLRRKEALLLVRLERLKAVKRENQQLHELINTAPQIEGKVSGADILSINIQSGNQTLTLNKGRSDNVFVGQPVLDAHGLIGQVIRTDWYSATVLLLTDLKSAVPVESVLTGEQGILVGTGSVDKLKLNNLPKTTRIKKGDELLTSGLGGHFPGGYPVGHVKTVKNSSTDMFAQIWVTPMSYMDINRPIFLLWPNPKPHSFILPIT